MEKEIDLKECNKTFKHVEIRLEDDKYAIYYKGGDPAVNSMDNIEEAILYAKRKDKMHNMLSEGYKIEDEFPELLCEELNHSVAELKEFDKKRIIKHLTKLINHWEKERKFFSQDD